MEPLKSPNTRIQGAAARLLSSGFLLGVSLALATVQPATAQAVDDCTEPFFQHCDLDVVRLTGSLLSSAPTIRQPTELQVVGSHLWVRDEAADPWLHVLDKGSGDLLASHGRRGEGEGEFVYITAIGVVPSSAEALWAFDGAEHRLTTLRYDPEADFESSVTPLSEQWPVSRLVWVGNDHLVAPAYTDAARLVHLSAAGDVREVGSTSLLGHDSIDFHQRVRASHSLQFLCAAPDGASFAIAYGSAGRFDIHDRDGSLAPASVPFPADPSFEPSESGDSLVFRHDRTWYLGCTATTEHVFALFSGRMSDAYSPAERDSGEFVHVFRWNGELEAIFRLSEPVRGLAVDGRTNVLYAASMSEGSVFRYDIPDFQDP